MRRRLARWREDPRSGGLSAAAVKRCDAVVKPFLAAREAGKQAYAELSRRP